MVARHARKRGVGGAVARGAVHDAAAAVCAGCATGAAWKNVLRARRVFANPVPRFSKEWHENSSANTVPLTARCSQ